jgi:hypothetical protein
MTPARLRLPKPWLFGALSLTGLSADLETLIWVKAPLVFALWSLGAYGIYTRVYRRR